MSDQAYQRYVHINLPHARTIVGRIGRSLEALGAFGEEGNGGSFALHQPLDRLELHLREFDDDPPLEAAISVADQAAAEARVLIEAILATPFRSDRLGQHIRNLFECLGLAAEGAEQSLRCGERPDSPLR